MATITPEPVLADHGWYALATGYFLAPPSVNAYTSGGMAGDAAVEFISANRSYEGQFVIVNATDLFIYRSPDKKASCLREPVSR
jgi:hypothetical protein